MIVYRMTTIYDDKDDFYYLSGEGAYRYSGRWNSKGIYALYTSLKKKTAIAEVINAFPKKIIPVNVKLLTIEIDIQYSDLLKVNPKYLKKEDLKPVRTKRTQQIGDLALSSNSIGMIVPSAMTPKGQLNIVLNPTVKDFKKKIRILKIEEPYD